MKEKPKPDKCKHCSSIDTGHWKKNFDKKAKLGYNWKPKCLAKASQKRYNIKNKEKIRTKFRKAYKEKYRYTVLKKAYGITKEKFEDLISLQSNRCLICNELFDSTPYVDHCHKTGEVRGLLHMWCNLLVGTIEKHKKLIPTIMEYVNGR